MANACLRRCGRTIGLESGRHEGGGGTKRYVGMTIPFPAIKPGLDLTPRKPLGERRSGDNVAARAIGRMPVKRKTDERGEED